MDEDYLRVKRKLSKARRKLKRMKYNIDRQQTLVLNLEDEFNWMWRCMPCPCVESSSHQAVERSEVETGSSEGGCGDFKMEGVENQCAADASQTRDAAEEKQGEAGRA